MISRVVCLNCMDGRAQIPVINHIKEIYQVEFVDMVTEAGMDGFLSNESNVIDSVEKKIGISIEKNYAQLIFVVGHFDCKGHPVEEDEHKSAIVSSVERVQSLFEEVPVIGLWVNSEWSVEKIT